MKTSFRITLLLFMAFVTTSCLENSTTFGIPKSLSNPSNPTIQIPKSGWIRQLGSVSSTFGATGAEYCTGVATDSSGNVYCGGWTSGALGEANAGNGDAFVMKLNSSGVIQWITQLGVTTKAPGGDNSGNDQCNGIAVDNSGNVYCAGNTDGDMGEANAGAADAFVFKLNSNGALQWLTHLGAVTVAAGGSNGAVETCKGVSVDNSGNVYCAGSTDGSIGEASGGGGSDAFVMKLDATGALQWVKQFGATTVGPGGSNSGMDACLAVTSDPGGDVFCAGVTSGDMGEAYGGGALDVFVMKLNTNGALQWFTQLGATTAAPGGDNSGTDQMDAIALDSNGNVYAGGMSNGSFGETNAGNYDAFFMKLNASGALQWVTQLGSTT